MSAIRISQIGLISCLVAISCLGSPCAASTPPDSPAVWDLGTLDGTKTYPTTITAANLSCRGRHTFAISIVDTPWLRLAGPAVLEKISMGESKVSDAVVDPRGLRAGEYRGRIEIRCTSCPPPPKCQQNLSELEVRMRVGAGAAGKMEQPESPREEGESFTVKDRSQGLVAEYGFRGRTLTIEFRRAGGKAEFSARDAVLGEVFRLRIPEPAPAFLSKEAFEGAGNLAIGEGFRRAKVNEQVTVLALIDRASRLAEEELKGVEPESTTVAFRAVSRFIAVKMEGGGGQGEPQYIIAVGPNDGRCHGACGPGCGWCACSARWCACEINLFCYAHDSCCGAWEDFFNCGPCTWERPWVSF